MVEYRTLGGFMHSTPELIQYVYRQTIEAVKLFNSWTDEYQQSGSVVEKAINSGDVEFCIKLCKMFNIEVPEKYLQLQLITV